MPTPRGSKRAGRSVPALYGLVSLMLVAGAVALALSTPPPSTPPLAAVAPAPQEQVEVERIEQDSRFGDGNGGHGDCDPGDPGCDGAGATEPTPTSGGPSAPTAAPSEIIETRAPGAFRRCYNGGLTQSPDPQSPPCIPEVFQADNGGATWRGVTADAIRVGVPWPMYAQLSANTGDQQREDDFVVVQAYARHVERYYELYGRRIELVKIDRPDGDGPSAEGAFAEDVAAADVFAVLDFEDGSIPFYRGLAERGVVAVDGALKPVMRSAVHEPHAPHVWGIYPAVEEALAATGDLACSALVGRSARHGGDEVAGRDRVFGIVTEQEPGRAIDAGVLASRLTACDGSVHSYAIAGSDDVGTLLRRMRDDDVTTIVCVCFHSAGIYLGAAAEIEFEPEWLLGGFPGFADTQDLLARGVTEQQRAHVFGLEAGFRAPDRKTRGLAWEDFYWHSAAKDEEPDFAFDQNNNYDVGTKAYSYYAQIALVLGAGIQAAGPDLTPETFGKGLQGLKHPNPAAGAAPWFQPSVGLGAASWTLNHDFALTWWQGPGPTGQGGRLCYVGGGVRYTVGTFPADADELFFDPEAGCR